MTAGDWSCNSKYSVYAAYTQYLLYGVPDDQSPAFKTLGLPAVVNRVGKEIKDPFTDLLFLFLRG